MAHFEWLKILWSEGDFDDDRLVGVGFHNRIHHLAMYDGEFRGFPGE